MSHAFIKAQKKGVCHVCLKKINLFTATAVLKCQACHIIVHGKCMSGNLQPCSSTPEAPASPRSTESPQPQRPARPAVSDASGKVEAHAATPQEDNDLTYPVTVVGENFEERGAGEIVLTKDNIILLCAVTHVAVGTFPLRYIRRYGYEKDIFSLEAGRRCATGEGIYMFRTEHAAEVYDIVANNVRSTMQSIRSKAQTPPTVTLQPQPISLAPRPQPPTPAAQPPQQSQPQQVQQVASNEYDTIISAKAAAAAQQPAVPEPQYAQVAPARPVREERQSALYDVVVKPKPKQEDEIIYATLALPKIKRWTLTEKAHSSDYAALDFSKFEQTPPISNQAATELPPALPPRSSSVSQDIQGLRKDVRTRVTTADNALHRMSRSSDDLASM
eukprot:Colp12_sorted_trinity150504_noHs@24775